MKLAHEAGTTEQVYAIGNKIVDDDDLVYLKNIVGEKLIAHIPQGNTLRKLCQQGKHIESISGPLRKSLEKIEDFARTHEADPAISTTK